jgi:hypothetical protein
LFCSQIDEFINVVKNKNNENIYIDSLLSSYQTNDLYDTQINQFGFHYYYDINSIYDESDTNHLDDEHEFSGILIPSYIYVFEHCTKTDSSLFGIMVELMRLTQDNNIKRYKDYTFLDEDEYKLMNELFGDNQTKLLKYFFNFLKKYKLRIVKLFNWTLMKKQLNNYLKYSKHNHGVYPTYKTHFKCFIFMEIIFLMKYFTFVFCK